MYNVSVEYFKKNTYVTKRKKLKDKRKQEEYY